MRRDYLRMRRKMKRRRMSMKMSMKLTERRIGMESKKKRNITTLQKSEDAGERTMAWNMCVPLGESGTAHNSNLELEFRRRGI